jgi:zinc transport system substrate-binding protein
MKKSYLYAITIIGMLAVSCGRPVTSGPLVITTLFPQYSLANQLAGDLATVEFILPLGSDPHDFEPSPSQRVKLDNADLIFYTSEEFEAWIHNIEDTAKGELINLSTYVNLIPFEEHTDLFGGPLFVEIHEEGLFDPHYWLDPVNGLLMLEAISDHLIQLLPEHELLLQSRKMLIAEALEDAIVSYQELVAENEEMDIVFAGHNAFGYFTNYHIHVLTPYPGFSSDVLPTPQSIIYFLNLMAELQTKTLFVSSTDNNAIIDILIEANPTIETLVIYTIENISLAQFNANTSYQEIILLNYEALAQSE